MFAKYGSVEDVAIVRDRYTGKPKGCAFVVMEAAAASKAMLELNGKDYGGRKMQVEPSKDYNAQGPRPTRPGTPRAVGR